VPRCDLGLAVGAIRLGGGTVTATHVSDDAVDITYVTYGRRTSSTPDDADAAAS
jgi:hypothetical protein